MMASRTYLKNRLAQCFVALAMLYTGTLASQPFMSINDDGLQQRLYFAMNAPDRPTEDIGRDMDRKPAEILAFFGVRRGMTVLELMAGSGYFTEMLSAATGNEGKVYAHNDVMALRMRHGAIQKAMDRRLARNRLPNTQLWTRDITALGLNEEVDMATLVLNLHDLYIFGGEQHVLNALASVMQALKPGGTLGIIDHAGIADYNNQYLHRIDPRIASELLIKAGFIIQEWSSLLANFEDNHSLHVFDPQVRGKTDQFIIRAMKPRY